jgi:hypothetical protein
MGGGEEAESMPVGGRGKYYSQRTQKRKKTYSARLSDVLELKERNGIKSIERFAPCRGKETG